MNLQNQLNAQSFDHYIYNEFYKHLIDPHFLIISIFTIFEPDIQNPIFTKEYKPNYK
jgi:hypothetical protein